MLRKDKVMEDVPQSVPLKKCSACKEWKPATPEYFVRSSKSPDGLYGLCKKCNVEKVRAQRSRNKDQTVPQYVTVSEIARRIGTSRHKVKHDIRRGMLQASKGLNVHSRTGFEYRVILDDAETYIANAMNGHAQIITSIEQISRPITAKVVLGTPDLCGSCSTTQGNIVSDDVDGTPGEKYGWLCMNCYRVVHAAKRDQGKLRKVLTYLEQTS